MENRRISITKQLLCESFMSLLKQKPIDKISVTELCQAANVNRGSFYAHYADVYDLLGQIESIVYERLCNAVKNCNYTRSDFPLINRVIEAVKAERSFCDALFGKYGSKQFLDKCCEINRQDITNEWRKKYPGLDDLTLHFWVIDIHLYGQGLLGHNRGMGQQRFFSTRRLHFAFNMRYVRRRSCKA